MFHRKSPFMKNYYVKLLFSFILMSTIITISTSIVFSKIYMDSIYNQLRIQYINDLDRINGNVDNIVKQLEQANIYLRQNDDINSFLTSTEYDWQTANRAYNYLMAIKQMNPYVRSIYLYNKDFNVHLHTGLSDIDINEILSESSGKVASGSPFHMVFSTINFNPLSGTKPVPTISFVFKNPLNISAAPENAVIINLERQVIEKDILSKFAGITIVTDAKGKLIFNPLNYPTTGSVAIDTYFKKILEDGEIKGSLNFKTEDGNKIVTYIRSLETDCYLINIISVNDIAGIIRNKRNTIILVSMCGLFLFSLAGFFVTKRIYLPISKVTELFTSSNVGIQNNNMGEFAVISKVFNDTLQRYKVLEDKSLNKNLLLKENFLRDLLKSKSIIDNYEIALQEYNINIEFSNMILVAVKIDKFNQIDPSKRGAYESTLCKIIPELLNENFICETVNMYDGEIALLLNYKTANPDNFELLLTNMDKLRDISRKTLEITLSIGIGDISNHIGECHKAYAAAVEMLKYRFTLGFDRCIYKRYLEENLSTNIYFPAEIEYNLISSLKLSKRELFIEGVHQIIDLIKNYPYSDAVYIFFQITLTCIKTINQTIHQNNNKFHIIYDKFNNIFVELQTLDQSADWLINTFDEYQKMLNDINQLKNSKHYKTVEEIQNYISEHYQDINLSVESIAEITGYTPYYFSKIFKEISGLNINDYIRQIRIDKAKELLTTSNCKVNEIPEMLGFTSASHFFSAFKKDVGLTPVAYREYFLSKMQNHLSV